MGLNKEVESPSRRTGDWGFIGYLEDGRLIPIGVYSCYADGAAHANSWLRATPNADRWEGQPLYEPILEDEDG